MASGCLRRLAGNAHTERLWASNVAGRPHSLQIRGPGAAGQGVLWPGEHCPFTQPDAPGADLGPPSECLLCNDASAMPAPRLVSQVLHCHDHATGRDVALKIVRCKRRFQRQAAVEVSVLQQLRDQVSAAALLRRPCSSSPRPRGSGAQSRCPHHCGCTAAAVVARAGCSLAPRCAPSSPNEEKEGPLDTGGAGVRELQLSRPPVHHLRGAVA